jgi:hypothetical protein
MMLVLMPEELVNITRCMLRTSSDKPTNEGVALSTSVDGLCSNFYPFNSGLNMNMAEDCSVGGIMIEQQNSGSGQKRKVFYLLRT